MQPQPTRAVIYTRISDDKSGDAASNQRQEVACAGLAQAKGWDVVDVVHDVSKSAYTGKTRPGWQRVLEKVEGGAIDVIVAYHVDRITRSMVDLEHLIELAEKHGITIATATGDIDLTNDAGRMIARILAAVARGEVERKGARQKLASDARAAAGAFPKGGRRTFGYTAEGQLITDEAALIRQGVSDLASGVPMREIARRWTASGLLPTSGSDVWRPQSVRYVLTNPTYAALRVHRGEVVGPGEWDAIISTEQHYEARAVVSRPSRKVGGNPGGRKAMNLMSGIAECPSGHPIHSGRSRGKPRYTCAQGCVSLDRGAVDGLVRSAIAMTLSTTLPGTLMPAVTVDAEADLLAKREDLIKRRDNLARMFGEGTLTEAEWEVARLPIVRELDEVDATLEVKGTRVDPKRVREQARRRFAGMTLAEEREMLLALDAQATLWPVGRGRRNIRIAEHVTLSLRAYTQQREDRVPRYAPADATVSVGERRITLVDRESR